MIKVDSSHSTPATVVSDLKESPAPATTFLPPFRLWLVSTILLVGIAASLFVLLNIKLDAFGLNGRKNVRLHTLPRYATYLMTFRFIPENFDGILIGNSEASALDTSQVHSYKIFNAAMRASSVTEERILAEEVLKRGHLKVALIMLNPTFTATHYARSAYMTPHDYTASFGSVQTLITDVQMLRERIGHPGPITYDAYGRTLWPILHVNGPWSRFRAEDLALDPVEMKDLNDLIARMQAKNVQVYAIFAPMYQPKWDAQREQLLSWQSAVLAGLPKGLTVLRLPEKVERDLQASRENFPDYTHMTAAANATVMRVVADAIDGQTTGSTSH